MSWVNKKLPPWLTGVLAAGLVSLMAWLYYQSHLDKERQRAREEAAEKAGR